LLAVASLLLCVATVIADWVSHDVKIRHWVYFATSDRGPTLVDGTIEFGFLGTPQPFVRTNKSLGLGFSWGGSYEYSGATRTFQSHDIEDNFARNIVWNIGGISETVGQIIPPWGQTTDPQGSLRANTEIPYTEYKLPIVYLLIPLALIPALWLRRRRLENYRLSLGHCPACGYDLRATPDRCPECGTARSTEQPI
jgi:hypothetical protein